MASPTQSIALPTDLPAGVSVLHTPEPEVLEALRHVRQLDGLTETEYLWLVQHSWEFSAPTGTRLFSDGDPATHMTILLAGEVQVRRQHAAHGSLFIGRSGQITGVLPFSRMKTTGGSGYVSEAVWALQVPRDLFPEMLAAIPSMGQRSVSILLDRVREVTRLEQQSEKLSALGKLAANLAHELNNPASAAQRASSNLMEELRAYGKVSFEAGRLCLTNEQEECYMEWNRNIRSAIEGRTNPQNPIEAGALEERLNRWLEPDHRSCFRRSRRRTGGTGGPGYVSESRSRQRRGDTLCVHAARGADDGSGAGIHGKDLRSHSRHPAILPHGPGAAAGH